MWPGQQGHKYPTSYPTLVGLIGRFCFRVGGVGWGVVKVIEVFGAWVLGEGFGKGGGGDI